MSTKPRALIGRTPWPSQGSPDDARQALAPRQHAAYTCQRGHAFEVVFAATATAPASWDCRCGRPAGLTPPDPGPTDHQRRMEQVLQRRTTAELDELLTDRLASMPGRPG